MSVLDAGTESERLLVAIERAVTAMTTKLESKDADAKVSVTDLVRLLQLRKELQDEVPRHISARWIASEDECNTSID